MKKYLLCAFASVGSLCADQSIFSVISDGYVQSSGVLGLSTDDTGTFIGTSRSGGNNIRQAMYEFDLSGLPDGATIMGASFFLRTSSPISNTDPTVTVRLDAYIGDGAVTTGDFDALEGAGGNLVDSLVFAQGTAAGLEVEFVFDDLTTLQAAYESVDQFVGLRTETHNFATFQVHSSENLVNAAFDPSLEITFVVPEPSAFALIGGLLALGCVALRRR